MNFNVDRNTWRCGGDSIYDKHKKGNGPVMLRNSDKFMCCLGHVGLQCGLTPDELNEVTEPCDLVRINGISFYERLELEDKIGILALNAKNTRLSSEAISINDDPKISTKTRETKLTKLFDTYGHTLTFTGKCVNNEEYEWT